MITPLIFNRFSPELLSNMGVRPCSGPFPIPLYAQKMMVDDDPQPIPGMIVSHIEDVDQELQSLISIILQISDGRLFRRWVNFMKKERNLLTIRDRVFPL